MAKTVLRASLLLIIGICLFGSIFILHIRINTISSVSISNLYAPGMVTIGHPGSEICRMMMPLDLHTAGILKQEDIWAALSACAERERETALDHPPLPFFDI